MKWHVVQYNVEIVDIDTEERIFMAGPFDGGSQELKDAYDRVTGAIHNLEIMSNGGGAALFASLVPLKNKP